MRARCSACLSVCLPVKVISRCMEAVVSYYTHDAGAERSHFTGLDVKQTIACVQLLYPGISMATILGPPHPAPPNNSSPHCMQSVRPALAIPAAAAAAEITTEQPGRRPPADAKDDLHCQKPRTRRNFPTLCGKLRICRNGPQEKKRACRRRCRRL